MTYHSGAITKHLKKIFSHPNSTPKTRFAGSRKKTVLGFQKTPVTWFANFGKTGLQSQHY